MQLVLFFFVRLQYRTHRSVTERGLDLLRSVPITLYAERPRPASETGPWPREELPPPSSKTPPSQPSRNPSKVPLCHASTGDPIVSYYPEGLAVWH